jgi:acyl-coenzyme A thioesterase PaaI-like protein
VHPARDPKALSPSRFRTLLGLFPPFLLSRTRVVRVAKDFRRCRVRVRPSLLTRNLQGSMFGGTIFAAADPFFALLYWQVFAHRGIRIHAWTRSARIEYRKPVSTPLTIDFELGVEDLRDAGAALDRDGRFARLHKTRAVDETGDVCAVIELEVYLRLPDDTRRGTAAP